MGNCRLSAVWLQQMSSRHGFAVSEYVNRRITECSPLVTLISLRPVQGWPGSPTNHAPRHARTGYAVIYSDFCQRRESRVRLSKCLTGSLTAASPEKYVESASGRGDPDLRAGRRALHLGWRSCCAPYSSRTTNGANG